MPPAKLRRGALVARRLPLVATHRALERHLPPQLDLGLDPLGRAELHHRAHLVELRRVELLDLGGALLVEDEDAPLVPARAAVVGRREDREQHRVVQDLEPTLTLRQLVRAHHRLDPVALAKVAGDVGAEGGGECAARRPHLDALARVRVRPQRVKQEIVISRLESLRRVAPRVDPRHVLESDAGFTEEAAMDYKGPLADDRGDRHRVEEALEELHQVLLVRILRPELPRKPAAVCKRSLVQIALLVVAAVDVDAARVGELVGEEEEEDLERVPPAIGNVAVEEVHVGRRWLAVLVEDPEHVLQLAVRIPADEDSLGGARGGRHALEGAVLGVLLLVQLVRRRDDREHAPP